MARTRQVNANNYRSPDSINAEFENLVRTVNDAEIGDKTIGELLRILFNRDGILSDSLVSMRRNENGDIEFRVGIYDDPTIGWNQLATAAELRGEKGQDFGELGDPVLTNRLDYTANAGDTEIDYFFETGNSIVVYKDGLVQVEGATADYTIDAAGGTNNNGSITFVDALSAGENITIYRVRTGATTGFERADFEVTAAQSVFPFEHTETDNLQVYRNGMLQRPGTGNDYTVSHQEDQVVFFDAIQPSNDPTQPVIVTILNVTNTPTQQIVGIMTEDRYVDIASGLLAFDKIKIDDNAIGITKVDKLVEKLNEKGNAAVGRNAPENPKEGDMWFDTSQPIIEPKFWNGTEWILFKPNTTIPRLGNALTFLQQNENGNGLQWAEFDISNLIPEDAVGRPNGVASLDSSGRLPFGQLPRVLSGDTIDDFQATPANQKYRLRRVYRQNLQIDGYSVRVDSGTCKVQLFLNNVAFGSKIAVSSTAAEQVLTDAINVEGIENSVLIEYEVTDNAAASNLDVAFSLVNVSGN